MIQLWPFFLHKGALEPREIKGGRHTSYMVYGTLTVQLESVLQPEVIGMRDNKHHICSVHKKLSFFVTVQSVLIKNNYAVMQQNHVPEGKQ